MLHQIHRDVLIFVFCGQTFTTYQSTFKDMPVFLFTYTTYTVAQIYQSISYLGPEMPASFFCHSPQNNVLASEGLCGR